MSISYLPLGDGQHTSLNFRLLKLLPGEEGSQLRVHMSIVSIHNAPLYRAISYTWGNPFAKGERNNAAELEEIIVDGKPVKVSTSVSNAIKAIRDWHPGVPWVWADAICIDQNNPRERGQQVVFMSLIYSQAESVFTWLGPATEDSTAALNLLRDLSKDRPRRDARDLIIGRAADVYQKPRWQALANLMDRRWWTRAWILQENVLARRIDFACGRTVIDGESVLNGFDAIEDYRDKVADLLSGVQGIELNVHSGNVINGMSRMRAARLNGTVFPMPTCHFRSMSAMATDPRDYVYAKLGLASDGHFIEPDYTASVEDVYRDYVAGYIKATGSLEITFFDARPRETPKLPSWVPDWNSSYGAHPLVPVELSSIAHDVPLLQADQSHQSEAHQQVAEFDFTKPDGSRLIVKGHFFDVLDGVSKAGEIGWRGTTELRPMKQTESKENPYGSDEATFNAVARTLLANQAPENRPMLPNSPGILAEITNPAKLANALSGVRFVTYYENVKDLRVGNKTVDEWMAWGREFNPTLPFSAKEQLDTEEAFMDAVYFRRLGVTSHGYSAILSTEAESGDYLVVVKGSRLPIVLRRIKKEGEPVPEDLAASEWALVGSGYAHHVMEKAGPLDTTIRIL